MWSDPVNVAGHGICGGFESWGMFDGDEVESRASIYVYVPYWNGVVMDERKAPQLTDAQANIVSETFLRVRKTIELAKRLCDVAECDPTPVLEVVADLTATYCGQQIK